MKQINAYIHHCRSTNVLDALQKAGYKNVALLDVKGTLKPLNETELAFTSEARVVISEVLIVLFCKVHQVEKVTQIIRENAYIGNNTSGWIYVAPVEQTIEIKRPPKP